MKLINRVLSLLLVAAMLIAAVPVFAAEAPQIVVGKAWPEYADGTPEDLASVDVSSDEQIIAIPVTIKNNPGFTALELRMTLPEGWSIVADYTEYWHAYNNDNYSLLAKSGRSGAVLKELHFIMPNPETNKVTLAGPEDITGDGMLFCAFVSVPKGAANGENTVAITVENAENAAKENFTSKISVASNTIKVIGGVDKLNDSNTTFEGLEETYIYNDGNAIEPAFTVKYGDKTLTKGADYTVSYENNTAVGTATVTVTGAGSYKGSVSTTFEIVKKTGTISGTRSYTKVYGDAAFTLDAVANSGAALSYTSDNGSVATVDATGKVTVVGSGSAVITVSAVETENYTKPVDFKVNVTVGKAGQTLTGESSYTKTYGDPAFDLNVGGAKGALTYTSSKPSVATVDAAGKVTVVGVGETVITVTAAEVAGQYNAATTNVTVTVGKKEVSVSGITVADKTYDKTTAATVTSTGTINGKVTNDDLDVNVTGVFANANAGENKTVNLTVSLTGAAAANYKLAADSQTTATASIEKESVAVPAANTGLVYNTKEQTGVEATADYTVVGGSGTDADDYTATVTLKDAVNYEWADDSFNGTVAWSIAKADAEALTMSKSHRYTTTEIQNITAAEIAVLLNKPGTVTITDCVFSGDAVLGTKEFTSETITYALASDLSDEDAGKSAVITATIHSDNYNDVTLTVTITVQDKVNVSEDIVFADGSADYTGKVQKHETATYNGSSAGITYSYSADPVNVGTYKVTATYEDADNYGKKTVDFRIDAAELTVTGATAATKKYDGGTAAEIESVSFSGLVNGETLTDADYTVTAAAFNNANVGQNKTVTYAVALNDTAVASNYVLTGTAPATTGKIEAKEITVALGSIANQIFSGNKITPAVTVAAEGTVDGYVLASGTDYTVSYQSNTNVGTAKAVVKAKSGSNYTFANAEATFQITKAAAPSIADMAAEYTYNYTGTETFEINGIPANAGTVTYEIGTLTGETAMVSAVSAASGKVSLTVEAVDASYVGKSVTVPVTIKMQNYADVTIDVVITRIEKDQPVLAVQPIEKTYDGKMLTEDDIVGTATFEGERLAGEWVWVTDPATMVNAKQSGYAAVVKFIPDNSDDFMEVEAELTVVIKKANPTGQPSYTRISSDGKTLADAELEIGTITPEGTIAWVDDPDTVVKKRVEYEWIFTPDDTTNYNTLTGEIMLYSGYSGGSFGPSFPEHYEPEDDYDDIIDQFYDVNYYDWYAEAVEMVVSEGLFEGVSANRFDPNGTMTRAMLVTVLWRLDGEPDAYTVSQFADVSRNAWYAEAVAWASEEGIVTGITETVFAPNQNVTREQMAAILYRYAKSIGVNTSARADLSGYADDSSISAYADNAMEWAVAEGLITGMTKTTLAPKSTATRAQVATILMRFVDYVL